MKKKTTQKRELNDFGGFDRLDGLKWWRVSCPGGIGTWWAVTMAKSWFQARASAENHFKVHRDKITCTEIVIADDFYLFSREGLPVRLAEIHPLEPASGTPCPRVTSQPSKPRHSITRCRLTRDEVNSR